LEAAKYGVVRSLASKCVQKNETGKIISALALISSIVPMISFPAMQMFYNKTLEIFPAAGILLSASILLLATFLNFFIYNQRWRIALFTSQNDVDPKIETLGNTCSKNDNHQLHQLSSL